MADTFAIITWKGVSRNPKEGSNYWSILSDIYEEYQSAGGNWDRPSMLLLNGKVVVEKGLADLAWEYGKDRREAYAKAAAEVVEKHTPAWLPTKQDGGK